jgi:hypothetical protein
MKSFTSLVLLALAFLAVVNAGLVPRDTIPTCQVASAFEFDSNDALIELKKLGSKEVKANALEATFTSKAEANTKPEFYVNFWMEGGSQGKAPSGTITSISKDTVLMKIELVNGGYPKPAKKDTVYLKIDSDSTCTTGLPYGFFPGSITKIVAGVVEEAE